MEISVSVQGEYLCIKLGDAELKTAVQRISSPSLGINLGISELGSWRFSREACHWFTSILQGFLTNLLKGNHNSAEAKVLAGLTKLRGRYAVHLLGTAVTNLDMAILEAEHLLQFESRGYWYFPKAKQLLIKPVERNDHGVLIEFMSPYQTTCIGLTEYETARALMEGISTGQIGLQHSDPPRMSSTQIEILKNAVTQVGLPQETADLIRRIALYVDYRTIKHLFQKLRAGDFRDEKERATLISRTNDILAEKARIERYRQAQNQEFVFLEDRGELVVPGLRLLVHLGTESPQVLQVASKFDYEIGKYIVTRKWSKEAKLEEATGWHLYQLAEMGTQILKKLPEPYRSRLAALILHFT